MAPAEFDEDSAGHDDGTPSTRRSALPCVAPPANDAFGPVLLARPRYAGTVAAIRDLARDNIPVAVLSEGLLDCSRWSRHVGRRIAARSQADPKELLASLRQLVADGRDYLLLPTCDTSAWTYAAFADQLAPDFRLYAPSLETMERILDKPSLEAACADVGLPCLQSWIVRDEVELAALAPTLPFPIMIKPRTHVRRLRNDKGAVVRDKAELIAAWHRLSRRETRSFAGSGATHRPILYLQHFVSTRERGVLSVAGFIDRSGRQFVARAARKVMLRSEPAGVGVCFEATALEHRLEQAVAALCRTLGYFGVFEVEFVWDGADWAVIDFNPRFYNQMALDIARGMPLARLCYFDAIRDRSRLAALAEAARRAPAFTSPLCLRDGFTMMLILAARRLSGRLSGQDRLFWRDWNRENGHRMMDLIRSDSDPWVWRVHVVSELRLGLRKLIGMLGERCLRTLHG